MYVIKLIDGNFVEEITMDGNIRCCPLDYQAKKFHNKEVIKPYIDFIEKKHSKRTYKVLYFTTSTSEVEYY